MSLEEKFESYSESVWGTVSQVWKLKCEIYTVSMKCLTSLYSPKLTSLAVTLKYSKSYYVLVTELFQ